MADTAALLHDVLARLDALERRNDALERDNAILKQQNAELLARVEPRATAASTPDGGPGTALERLSRRWVLRRGMQVAAASVAAGVLLREQTEDAAAQSFDFVDVRPPNDQYALTAYAPGPNYPTVHSTSVSATAVYAKGVTGVHGESATNGSQGVYGQHTGTSGVGVRGIGSTGVSGKGDSGAGVYGEGAIGVRGKALTTDQAGIYGEHAGTGPGVVGDGRGNDRAGVWGRNSGGFGLLGEGRIGVQGKSGTDNWTAVVGEHTGSVGYGVLGIGKGAGIGVTGRSNGVGGIGVRGEATQNIGVEGSGMVGIRGTSSTDNYTGVVGEHTGLVGYGVLGVGRGAGVGVTGRAEGAGGIGVRGTSSQSNGVEGIGRTGVRATCPSSGGYGLVVEGGKAQLRIAPAKTAGKPTSGTHAKGELFVDKNATLWVCTANGTPGTWRKVSTTTA